MRVEGNSLIWPGRRLTCLYDGTVRFGADFFPDPRGAVIPETVSLPVQAYVLQSDGMPPVLIDSGSGALYGDAGGRVAPGLAAIGLAISDIGTVFLTHLHGDHIGGVLAEGYAGARLCLGADEASYWATQDHPAARLLAAEAGRITLMCAMDTLAPGIALWSLPGHTPGQTGLVIDGQVAILGDTLHRADIQLSDPTIATKFDVDPALASQTRKAALARIGTVGMVFCAGHVRAPGQEETPNGLAFLRLEAQGAGWRAVAP
jgi:glyoxylase-like metal-dependent hydrolase (beta-lactamase superfamily II)